MKEKELSYKRTFSESGQQEEGVQVSVHHEGKNHHGDRQPLGGPLVETHSYWTGRRVTQSPDL